jgi:hypothetical protein
MYKLIGDQDDNLQCKLPAANQPPCEGATGGGGNTTQTTATADTTSNSASESAIPFLQ